MPDRFAWKFPLLAALAPFVGWQAQMALGGPRPVDGLALYAAAIILFVSLHGGRSVLTAAPAAQPPDTTASGLSAEPGAWRILATLSILSATAALLAFWLPGRADWGWALHLLSLLLLLATAVRLPWLWAQWSAVRPGSFALSIRRRGGEWLLLLLILMFALAVRVWHNDSIPPGLYYDEAREGVVARRILSEPSYRPVYIAYIERPADHVYLVALAFALFGDSIASLRLVPAAFGVLNVLAAFLLFNRWFGRKSHAGLIAAALWAVTRYDLTFSRIVFDADSTPFFMMLTLFFLDRGFHGGKPRSGWRRSDFILAGLTLGIGQGFYLPMRIFVLLLVGLGLCLAVGKAWRDAATRRAHASGADRKPAPWRERSFIFLKPWVPHLLLALLLATAPIVEFALQSPGIFFDRNVNASIFYERAEPNLLLALYDSTLKHLGMFNYQGDQNARHNLPGAPMLDPLSGVLFLLGLGLAVRRWRDARNFAMLALFAGMLQAGILSTDSEAPQALRSVGVLPSVIYFMTLALAALMTPLSRLCGRLFARRLLPARAVPFVVLACALLVIAWFNLDLYFNRQANDAQVWRAHSPGEGWTASEMRRLASTHELILPARYEASPAIQYLAPEIAPSRTFTASDLLPLSPAPRGPAVLFLDSTLRDKLDEVRRVYPAAHIRELRPPDNSEPVVYEIILDF